MKCREMIAPGLLLIASPALANTELTVTGGGGVSSELATQGCLEEGQGTCRSDHAGAVLLGAGVARVSDTGVRGSLRLEGAFSFGQLKGRQAQILGTAGWQGDWLIAEGGLGSALLWGAGQDGATLAGVLHAGLGLRILPPFAVVARADVAISDRHQPFFLGLALEWQPLVALRGGS